MLTEQFIASIGVPSKAPGTSVAKDAAIFLHEYQPLSQQRAVFKKSATPPNGVAMSETHIFAAQAEKGVVHVYNREKGNQEATVPFTERISSITLACDDTVLVLGTNEGRIFLWETCTGRQVTTNQAHLQAVSALAVDSNSNFLLSASKDSTIHVWSIPALLSFANTTSSPIRTFSSHGAEITSLALGHSATACNFAVSVSRDSSCMIWDYRTGNVLRTYLLTGVPLCVSLDPADRAVYLGYEDGTLQQLDLYESPDGKLDAVQNGTDATNVVQPKASSKWKLPDPSYGPALSLATSYDGSTLISGHQSGAILSWDVARRSFVSSLTQLPLPGPINNILFLPVTGHQKQRARGHHIRINEVVKPKFGAFDNSDAGTVPGNYTMNVQLDTNLNVNKPSAFMESLTAPTFSTELLDEGLSELTSWDKNSSQANGSADEEADFMALDEQSSGKPSLQEENANLKAQLESLRRVQKKSFEKLEKLGEENKVLAMREKKRLAGKARKKPNGVVEEDESSD